MIPALKFGIESNSLANSPRVNDQNLRFRLNARADLSMDTRTKHLKSSFLKMDRYKQRLLFATTINTSSLIRSGEVAL